MYKKLLRNALKGQTHRDKEVHGSLGLGVEIIRKWAVGNLGVMAIF